MVFQITIGNPFKTGCLEFQGYTYIYIYICIYIYILYVIYIIYTIYILSIGWSPHLSVDKVFQWRSKIQKNLNFSKYSPTLKPTAETWFHHLFEREFFIFQALHFQACNITSPLPPSELERAMMVMNPHKKTQRKRDHNNHKLQTLPALPNSGEPFTLEVTRHSVLVKLYMVNVYPKGSFDPSPLKGFFTCQGSDIGSLGKVKSQKLTLPETSSKSPWK